MTTAHAPSIPNPVRVLQLDSSVFCETHIRESYLSIIISDGSSEND